MEQNNDLTISGDNIYKAILELLIDIKVNQIISNDLILRIAAKQMNLDLEEARNIEKKMYSDLRKDFLLSLSGFLGDVDISGFFDKKE